MAANVLDHWRRLRGLPLGPWLFVRLVCAKAPYFASIRPRMLALEPGRGVASIRRHRRITNHIGSIHAIALCNLAELVGGLACEASLPADMRWIPQGMQVRYLKKAMGTVTAVATPQAPAISSPQGYALPMRVDVTDEAGDVVFDAVIAMWVSPRRARTA